MPGQSSSVPPDGTDHAESRSRPGVGAGPARRPRARGCPRYIRISAPVSAGEPGAPALFRGHPRLPRINCPYRGVRGSRAVPPRRNMARLMPGHDRVAGGFPGPERRLAVARRPRSFSWARRRRLLLAWARRNGLYRPSRPAGTRRPRSFVWVRRGVLAATLLAVAVVPYPVAGSASVPSAGACHGPCRRAGPAGNVLRAPRAAGAVDHERRAHRHGPGQSGQAHAAGGVSRCCSSASDDAGARRPLTNNGGERSGTPP